MTNNTKEDLIKSYLRRYSWTPELQEIYTYEELEKVLNKEISGVKMQDLKNRDGQYNMVTKTITLDPSIGTGDSVKLHETTHAIFKGFPDKFSFNGRGFQEGGAEYVTRLLKKDDKIKTSSKSRSVIEVKSKSLLYPMENNIFEKLSIIYGSNVTLNAMKNGPHELATLMEADGKSYTELRAMVDTINQNNTKIMNNPNTKKKDILQSQIITSFTNATAELDDIILTQYQNLDKSNTEEYESVMSKMAQMAKLSNADSPIITILDNEYSIFKEQQDKQLIDNPSETDLKARENIMKEAFYNGDMQDIKKIEIQQYSGEMYLVSSDDKMYGLDKHGNLRKTTTFTINDYQSLRKELKEDSGDIKNYIPTIGLADWFASDGDPIESYLNNVDELISSNELDGNANIYFDIAGISIKNNGDISRYSMLYRYREDGTLGSGELQKINLSDKKNLVSLQNVSEIESEQINESNFIQNELSDGDNIASEVGENTKKTEPQEPSIMNGIESFVKEIIQGSLPEQEIERQEGQETGIKEGIYSAIQNLQSQYRKEIEESNDSILKGLLKLYDSRDIIIEELKAAYSMIKESVNELVNPKSLNTAQLRKEKEDEYEIV